MKKTGSYVSCPSISNTNIYSRCKQCLKIISRSDLEDNPNDVGLVCIDPITCKTKKNRDLGSLHTDV